MSMNSAFPIPSHEELVSFYSKSSHFDVNLVQEALHKTDLTKRETVLAWLDKPNISPNRYFSTEYYAQTYGINASHCLFDFLTHGWRVGRNPNKELDIEAFLHERSLSPFSRNAALDLLIDDAANNVWNIQEKNDGRLQPGLASELKSITVVTVNLNNYIGLEKTLRSLSEQEDSDFELIVIDGGSSDRSQDIIKSHSTRIDQVIIGEDEGIFDAMNIGNKAACGEYVIFMNSGDCFAGPACISSVRPVLGRADIVYGDARFSDSEEIHPYKDRISLGMTFCHQSQFTRKCWLERFPFQTHDRTADWRFVVLAYLSGATFRYIDVLLSVLEDGVFSMASPNENFLECWSFAMSNFPYDYVSEFFQSELEKRHATLDADGDIELLE